MKKFLALMFCISAILCLTLICASADVLTFRFDTAEKVNDWANYVGGDAVFSFDAESKTLKVTNKGLDPFVGHKFDEGKYIDGDLYKYVVYYFKITDGATAPGGGQFFFTSDTIKAGALGSYTAFSNSATNDWQSVVYDLTKLSWGGKISMFRVDHVDKSSSTVTSLIHSISFTSTQQEAIQLLDSFESDVNPNATEPQWILDNYATVERFAASSDAVSHTYENGAWTMTSLGSDPKLSFKFNVNEKSRAESYPYVAFRMKTTTSVKTGGLFFSTSVNKAMGPTYSQFDIKNTAGEWADYIIDMRTYQHGLWAGTVETVRLDMTNPGVAGDVYQIDRFGLFKTEDDAKAFLAKEVTLNIVESEIEEDESKIINSGAKTTKWDLRTKEDSAVWNVVGGKLRNELGFYSVISDTTDSRIQHKFTPDEVFDSKEFHYFAMRYNISASSTVGGLFFTNDNHSSYNDDTFTSFQLNTNGKWNNLILDMATSDKAVQWTGKIDSVRIDYLNPSPLNTEFTVSRIGFFRSRKEALEFLNGGNDEPDYSRGAEYSADFQSVIVPDGALYEGYKQEEYMLTNASSENVSEDAVVSFTDKNGNESIVALGNVNPFGYAKYVARKPGTYKITTFSKDYVDTAGHWGEKYIDYVSSRKLFGGTSETEFSPDMAMTRGMFITVLGRMHGLDTSAYDGKTGYGDVPATEYYAPYIQWAKEYAIMQPLSEVTFGAEDPISRKDMALAIANYVAAYEYNLAPIAVAAEFSDVVALTDAEKAAITSVQAAGIINGKGNGIFDPAGTSTRAEVATVMERTIRAILGVALVPTEYTAEYFDRDRIRIGVWQYAEELGTEEGVRTLSELGADLIVCPTGFDVESQNTLLNYTDKYGVEVFATGLNVTENAYKQGINYKAEAAYYAEHPSFNGHFFTDEPGTDSFGWLGAMANEYQAALPGLRPYVNLLPMYANAAQLKMGANAAAIEYYDSDPELYRKHCEAWFENFDVDYICTDIYPLNESNGKKITRAEYVEWINVIATVARENNSEFWCCIQTFGWTHGKRTPNEAEYRWQCYTMLSFGCTGILLWNYSGTANFPSLVHPVTLETTDAYYDCKTVMWEMRAISDTFVKYRNLGAFTVNCTAATPYLKMSGEYKDFTTLKEINSKDALLVGCFTAKEGDGKAFTITNMLDFQGNEAKTTNVSFVLDDMSKTVTSYYRGEPTVLTAENGAYNITLECGDGVLITVE